MEIAVSKRKNTVTLKVTVPCTQKIGLVSLVLVSLLVTALVAVLAISCEPVFSVSE